MRIWATFLSQVCEPEGLKKNHRHVCIIVPLPLPSISSPKCKAKGKLHENVTRSHAAMQSSRDTLCGMAASTAASEVKSKPGPAQHSQLKLIIIVVVVLQRWMMQHCAEFGLHLP